MQSNVGIKTKIFILGWLAALGPLAMDMYLPAFPAISSSIHRSIEDIQLTMTAYTLGFAFGQLFYGPLSDSIGRKKVINLGLLIYLISSLSICFSNSFNLLFILRLIQSLGAAAIMVTVPARVRDEFSAKEAAKVNSIIMLIITMAPLIAPIIGGWLLNVFPWSSIFVFMFIVSFAALIINILLLNDHRVVSPIVKKFNLPLKKYLEVIKNKKAMGYILCHGFFNSGMFAFITVSPYLYIEYYHVKVTNYGWFFAGSVAATSFASYFNSKLVNIISVKSLIIIGASVAFLASVISLCLLYFNIPALWVVFIGSCLYFACLGMISPNVNALALSLFKDSAGTASAVSGALRFGLVSVATAVVGLIKIPGPYPVFIIMAICGILSTGFLLFLSVKPSVHN
jgi:DHA1 family bicyclomycin/chloramphenicol resistance-like MFS transporter